MKKLIAMLILSAGFVCTAQVPNHYKTNGGSSPGKTTYYYNRNGSVAGRARTNGSTTYYYNGNGQPAGRSRTSGNTTYYYNRNGSPAGRSNK